MRTARLFYLPPWLFFPFHQPAKSTNTRVIFLFPCFAPGRAEQGQEPGTEQPYGRRYRHEDSAKTRSGPARGQGLSAEIGQGRGGYRQDHAAGIETQTLASDESTRIIESEFNKAVAAGIQRPAEIRQVAGQKPARDIRTVVHFAVGGRCARSKWRHKRSGAHKTVNAEGAGLHVAATIEIDIQ